MINNQNDYKVYTGENITLDMLNKINELDKKFYKDEYLWEFDYQLQLFDKNKNSMIIVTCQDKVVGYLNYLVITKEKYDEMINSNITIDEFELDEVIPFYQNKDNYLTINSVVIYKEFQDSDAVKILTNNLNKILKQMHYDNYIITGINGFAVSSDGRKFLERLGFEQQKVLDDNNCLYVLENEKLKEYLK